MLNESLEDGFVKAESRAPKFCAYHRPVRAARDLEFFLRWSYCNPGRTARTVPLPWRLTALSACGSDADRVFVIGNAEYPAMVVSVGERGTLTNYRIGNPTFPVEARMRAAPNGGPGSSGLTCGGNTFAPRALSGQFLDV